MQANKLKTTAGVPVRYFLPQLWNQTAAEVLLVRIGNGTTLTLA